MKVILNIQFITLILTFSFSSLLSSDEKINPLCSNYFLRLNQVLTNVRLPEVSNRNNPTNLVDVMLGKNNKNVYIPVRDLPFNSKEFSGLNPQDVQLITRYFKRKSGFVVFRNFNQDSFKLAKKNPERFITKPMEAKNIKSKNGFYYYDPLDTNMHHLLETNSHFSIVDTILNEKKTKLIAYNGKIMVSDPDPVFIGWKNSAHQNSDFYFDKDLGYVNQFQEEHIKAMNTILGDKHIQHGPQSNILQPIEENQFPMYGVYEGGSVIIRDENALRSFMKMMEQENYSY